MFLGVRQAEVGENVAASDRYFFRRFFMAASYGPLNRKRPRRDLVE